MTECVSGHLKQKLYISLYESVFYKVMILNSQARHQNISLSLLDFHSVEIVYMSLCVASRVLTSNVYSGWYSPISNKLYKCRVFVEEIKSPQSITL